MLRSVNTGPRSLAGGRVAAMPSVGRIQQLSLAGVVAVALLGAAASNAAASDVWLWACHGPASAQGAREAISTAPVSVTFGDGPTASVNGGCGGGADTVAFKTGNPAANSSAELKVPDAPNT